MPFFNPGQNTGPLLMVWLLLMPENWNSKHSVLDLPTSKPCFLSVLSQSRYHWLTISVTVKVSLVNHFSHSQGITG